MVFSEVIFDIALNQSGFQPKTENYDVLWYEEIYFYIKQAHILLSTTVTLLIATVAIC